MDIACPTLLFAGQYDKTGKVLAYCRAWHEKTGFPFTIVPDAAHNSNVDNAPFVNAAIEAFLAELPAE